VIAAVALLAYTNNFFQPQPASVGTLPNPPGPRIGMLNARSVRPPLPTRRGRRVEPQPACTAICRSPTARSSRSTAGRPVAARREIALRRHRTGPTKPTPPENELVKVWEFYAYVEAAKGEKVPDYLRVERVVENGKEKKTIVYRRLREEDHIESEAIDRVIIARKERVLRRLREGDQVAKGQLLAMVDPNVTAAELVNKLAKISASKAETDAALKTKDEAYQPLQDDGAAVRRHGEGAPPWRI
jgi:hypothetical protein